MAPITQVSPGDLITADLMNQILSRLGQLDGLVGQLGGAGGGPIVVPTLYGRTLSDARSIISNPAQQLTLGSVLDTAGNVVNVNTPQVGLLIVVSQAPQPGTRVAAQTSIDLLIAAQGGGGGSAPSPPSISNITPASAAVNSPVTIFGANFNQTPSLNTVRFDGVPGTVSNISNTQQLVVTVPTGIPGGPVNPGDPQKAGVSVTVSTPAGPAPNPGTITVTAPVPSTPTISGTTPQTAVVGQPLVITGTNFSTTPAQNTVTIGGTVANVTSAPTTQSLTVAVPLISGLNTVPSSRSNVPLVVTVNNIASVPFSISVARLS